MSSHSAHHSRVQSSSSHTNLMMGTNTSGIGNSGSIHITPQQQHQQQQHSQNS